VQFVPPPRSESLATGGPSLLADPSPHSSNATVSAGTDLRRHRLRPQSVFSGSDDAFAAQVPERSDLEHVDVTHARASWINLFVDFLVTKHGLAQTMQSDRAGFETLHAYFLDRLVPVCAQLLEAATEAGEIRPDIDALELLYGIGNLCIRAEDNLRYDARRMVELVIAGLRLP
jgi:hypothetical protein